ncbi:MAG: glucose-6-phosphate dehydrogenase assembly protein OpcA [Ardenticatenaceae bacterium]|nr:glucose-6-phosphate dehydrogenase assembly protein OpcA [Ardenticatenaceae bacterium]
MTDGTNTPFDGDRVSVSMGDIEVALAQMWREAGEATGPQVVHTRVLNLLICTEGEANAQALTEAIAALPARHPARTILLVAGDPEEPETLDAWIEMHCQIALGGRQQLCGEQISIHATGDAVNRLPSAALPLLLPDLPVVVYWREPLDRERALLHPLARLADRIILDSGLARDSLAVVRRLPAILDRYPGASIGDIIWARLTPWRELTAQLFDAQDLRPYLDTITAVDLTYGQDGEPLHVTQACFYLGWLVSCLNWAVETAIQVEGAGRVSVQLRSQHGRIAVRLEPGERFDELPDSLVGLVIHADGEPPARFEIVRADDRVCAISRVRLGEREILERVVTLPDLSEIASLSQELDQMVRDRTFEQAVRAAATIAGGSA